MFGRRPELPTTGNLDESKSVSQEPILDRPQCRVDLLTGRSGENFANSMDRQRVAGSEQQRFEDRPDAFDRPQSLSFAVALRLDAHFLLGDDIDVFELHRRILIPGYHTICSAGASPAP